MDKTLKITAWTVMSKDRKFVLTGNARRRRMTPVVGLDDDQFVVWPKENSAKRSAQQMKARTWSARYPYDQLQAVPVTLTIPQL